MEDKVKQDKKDKIKSKLHPRNRNNKSYDLEKLVELNSSLAKFIVKSKYGHPTVLFSDKDAVFELNKAILKANYGLNNWSLPKENLCPPIPGRADYIHYVADLLSDNKELEIPKGNKVKGLDIGVGANCIYPLIGSAEYDWQFVGSDCNEAALNWANKNRKELMFHGYNVQLRLQPDKACFFKNIIQPDEKFDFTVCNPPFHASQKEAAKASNRKRTNLKQSKNTLNFGGQPNELWCPGGEIRFVSDLIKESRSFSKNVLWFSTLISKQENVRKCMETVKQVGANQYKVVEMNQGNKTSRFLAWSYYAEKERQRWKEERWKSS